MKVDPEIKKWTANKIETWLSLRIEVDGLQKQTDFGLFTLTFLDTSITSDRPLSFGPSSLCHDKSYSRDFQFFKRIC